MDVFMQDLPIPFRTGKAYVASEVFDYLAAKARGEKVNRPRAKAWRP